MSLDNSNEQAVHFVCYVRILFKLQESPLVVEK